MSYRPFMPFSPPAEHYAYPSSPNYSTSGDVHGESAAYYPQSDSSFSALQAFCNRSRNSIAESAYAPSVLDSDVLSQYDVADLVTIHDDCFHRSRNSEASSTYTRTLQSLDCDAQSSQHDGRTDHEYGPEYDENDEEEGADWFDMEALGLDINDLDEDGIDSPYWRFDFPLPMLPVVPVEKLKMENFDGQIFYVDDEGYAQVYTQGECRVPFTGKASIGVWFGPNHPSNVSERLHRGRRTREAAKFAAVIEAIRVAGSHGIQKLQINTDYENVIRFVLYFILKWEQNNWVTLQGHRVKNRVLIRELDYFSRLIDIKWNLIPYHEGAEGNLEAGRLATEALDLQLPKVKSASKDMDVVNEGQDDQIASSENVGVTNKRRFVPIVF